ncbi:FkbM family methyltransferase [Acidimicrobiaceae bacterium USS-CC1]|uniref:FkbM family methyltransferase n=1 Tax=Acidiferrimicrobium australe TaxID=2664430 RepID=A0ABW9QU01_9ACTN|nr:FkbM family methyltransferase [Acidiferrimicrobium australe]
MTPSSLVPPASPDAAPAVGCRLVVPAYNEAARIGRCLDAVASSPLPVGWRWTGWTVLDGASTDGTPDVVRQWAERRRDGPPVAVLVAATRGGKAVDLGHHHARLLVVGDPEEIVVVVDADAAVQPGTFAALLAPFVEHPSTAVVWGVDVPDDTSIGRWASSFQMELVGELARRAGGSTPRAYGRLFAYRVGALRDFAWGPSQLDDMQLARFVAERSVPVASAWSATVAATPAHGWRDFYLQTYRFYWARAEEAAEHDLRGAAPGRHRRALDAFVAVARRHPARAGAYLLARLGTAAYHRLRREQFSAAWAPAASTKLPAGAGREGRPAGNGSALREAVGGRLALARQCRAELRNWPTVLARVVGSYLGWHRGVFTVSCRAGVNVRAPNRVLALSPVIEVLAGDAYRLRGLRWEDPSRARHVIDVGAHVGSFTCALAHRLPGARFTCVEPSPATLTWLHANLAANDLSSRAEVVAAAVAETDGEVDLWGTDDVSCEASAIAGSGGHPTPVTAMSFDSLLPLAGGRPDIVKLDCEGGEYAAVLCSAETSWATVQDLFLEYHPVPGHTFEEIRSRLAVLGLTLVWDDPDPRTAELGLAYFTRRPAPSRNPDPQATP